MSLVDYYAAKIDDDQTGPRVVRYCQAPVLIDLETALSWLVKARSALGEVEFPLLVGDIDDFLHRLWEAK